MVRRVDARRGEVQQLRALLRIRPRAKYGPRVLKDLVVARLNGSVTLAEISIALPTTPNCRSSAYKLSGENAEITATIKAAFALLFILISIPSFVPAMQTAARQELPAFALCV